MSRSRTIALALGLVGISGAALAIYSLGRDPRPELLSAVPGYVFESFLVVGLVSMGAAIMAFASLVIYVPFLSAGTPDCRPVKRNELEVLHEFSEQHLTVGTFTLNDAKRAYNLNRELFWGVWKERRKVFSLGFTSNVVGFFTLVPVNADAKHLLEENRFDGSHVASEYVPKSWRRPSAIYIGGVASSLGNKAVVLANLVQVLMALRKEGAYDVFTRPVTKRGLKLAEQYGFEPVAADGLEQIYRLNQTRFEGRFADPARVERVLEQRRKRMLRRSTNRRPAV